MMVLQVVAARLLVLKLVLKETKVEVIEMVEMWGASETMVATAGLDE